MSFLPTDYKEPVQSNYMNFEDGENTFRVLDSAVIGWEYWSNKNVNGQVKAMPTRVLKEDSIPMDEVLEGKYGLQLYFFWAFPVYNFNDHKVQILVLKQKTIRRAMQKMLDNKKWGDPKDYNFVVSKEKNGDKTEYFVSVEPKEPLDQSIIEKFQSLNLDMQVWFRGDDPFKSQSLSEAAADDVASALN